LEPIQTFFHPQITVKLFELIGLCETSLAIACYVIDEYYATALQQVMRPPRRVALSIIVDEGKLVAGTLGELRALLALMEWGAIIKSRRPPDGRGFASAQHEKCWLFDLAVFVCGSHNLTHNSAVNCEEAVTVTTERDSVDGFVQHFDHLWDTADGLSQERLEPMIQDKVDAQEQRRALRSASRSLPRAPGQEGTEAPPTVVD